jgi:hypothetical protein
MPQNFVAIQNTGYKVLTQHIIWRVRCVNEVERQWTDVDGRKGSNVYGRTLVDERGQTNITKQIDNNKGRTKQQRTSNEIKKGYNGIKRTRTAADYASDCAIERSTSASSVVMACRRKKRIFFSISCFIIIILFFFFFQSCYKGYSLHDYKLKNTKECTAHMLISKPMYKENKCIWGYITWCRSCITIKPCVCVCMFPRPKASSKTSFRAVHSLLPLNLWNSKLHNLCLFPVSFFPRLCYC